MTFLYKKADFFEQIRASLKGCGVLGIELKALDSLGFLLLLIAPTCCGEYLCGLEGINLLLGMDAANKAEKGRQNVA